MKEKDITEKTLEAYDDVFADIVNGLQKLSIYDTIPIPDRIRPYVSDYRINVFEITRLPEEAVGYFHSDFRIVVDYFIHKRTNPDYRPQDPVKFRHVDEVLKLFSAITQDRRFEETLTREGANQKTCVKY